MDFDESKDIDKALRYQVAKSNELIQKSRYCLALREQRALDYAISKIQKADPSDKVYRVDAKEAYRIVTSSKGAMGGNDYRNAYQIFKNLQGMPVEISPREGLLVSCNWFHHVSYDKTTGVIEFQFHNLLTPYLFSLRGNFSRYFLEVTVKMKCVYGPRLYQLLKAIAKGKKVELTIPLEQLKNDIGASLEAVKNRRGLYEVKIIRGYESYGKFKQAVLDPSVEDINRCSDIRVEYEPVKTGRRVTAIKFKVNDDNADSMLRAFEEIDRMKHPWRYA